MYCLDTNIVIGIITERVPYLIERQRAELLRGTRLAISSLVLFELRYGAAKSAVPDRNRARLDDYLLAISEIHEFEAEDAAEAGAIRAALEAQGMPIGPYDVLIAAQARRRGATLVTLNRRELGRVPDLQVTDWQT